jgi:hypothetical protein
VFAPYGLDDLFGLTLRRNPKQVSVGYFRQRRGQGDPENVAQGEDHRPVMTVSLLDLRID